MAGNQEDFIVLSVSSVGSKGLELRKGVLEMRLAALTSAIDFMETLGIRNEFDLTVIQGYVRWYLRS